MNDEIKEILECLSLIARNEYVPDELLNDEMCRQLLNYITNLQEENEKLNKVANERMQTILEIEDNTLQVILDLKEIVMIKVLVE